MPSGSSSRAARQAKIDAAAPKPSKSRPVLVAVVVVLALVAIGAAIWAGTRASDTDESAAGQLPAGVSEPGGGIVVNADVVQEGVPTLDIYEDFQCPACAQAHAQLGPIIHDVAEKGEAKVVYHLKTFLDDNLGNDSSKKATNAAACAADAGKFTEYHDAVYAAQPAQEGAGFTDEQIQQFATQAGITGEALTTWQQCESNDTYAGYVTEVEDVTARDGVRGTPTFRVDGDDLDMRQIGSPEEFRAAVTKG